MISYVVEIFFLYIMKIKGQKNLRKQREMSLFFHSSRMQSNCGHSSDEISEGREAYLQPCAPMLD